jgi:hypothetical protein
MRWACAVLSMMAVVLLSLTAMADGPEVKASIDGNVVGVGDDLHFTLKVSSTNGTPGDPHLTVNGGLRIHGTQSSPMHMMRSFNGVRSDQDVLNVTWTLRAERTGKYTIGPATISIDGKKFQTGSIGVTVVATGQAPPRQQSQDPFGGSGSIFDFPNRVFGGMNPFDDIDPPRSREPDPTLDPKLALDAPRGRVAFLHAVVDKTNAVVGEQVTLSVYLYVDVSGTREPQIGDLHEIMADDFLKRSLMEDDTKPVALNPAQVGGQIWMVQLVRRSALFPLKSGDLEIGPMTLTIGRSNGNNGIRESEHFHIHVTDPPLRDRPAGYAVGDVGHFNLSADVQPRSIDRDGAVGVTLTLTGTGNLPSSIATPTRAGIEWLTPETHEKLGNMNPQITSGSGKLDSDPSRDKFGGSRTFSYVVRIHQAALKGPKLNSGKIPVDLGDVVLPFWDPDQGRYAMARATLGTVDVTPGDPNAPIAKEDDVIDPLPDLPKARATLGSTSSVRSHMADSPFYWLGLGMMPLVYVSALGAVRVTRKLRQSRQERAASPRTELKARVRAAEEATEKADARAIDAAVSHALESATIAIASINVRGASAKDVDALLEANGVNADHAREVGALLRECEAARYAPEPPPVEDARARWQRARRVIDAMDRG